MDLFGVLDDLGLPEQMDFDLTGVLQLVLNLLGNVPGQQDHLVLTDDLGLDHDTHLAAGLDGEGFLHPVEGGGDLLQGLQALDIVLQVLDRKSTRLNSQSPY